MTMTTPETDDQRIERLQQRRVQMALKHLPNAIWYVRAIATSGEGERGETLPEWSAPMRITAAGAADDVYVQLVNWVAYLAEELKLASPASTVVAWFNFKEAQGFKAGTTPEGAHMLTRLQTMWLSIHFEQILKHDAAPAFRKNILELEAGLRRSYPRAQGPARPTHSRPCPVCKQLDMGADWLSADPLDVHVSCASCGHELPENELQDWMLPELFVWGDDESEDWQDGLDPVAKRCDGSVLCRGDAKGEHVKGCYSQNPKLVARWLTANGGKS